MDGPAPVKYLEIHGPISVEEVDESDNDKLEWGFVILLTGLRESGKSTFIEMLSWNGPTKIELPSSTQSIIPYRIQNVTWRGHAVHIVDVPGFMDTKISDITRVSVLGEWIKDAGPQVVYHIVYFMTIDTPRLPVSQRQVLRAIQSLIGVHAATNITFATTMCHNISNETIAKSERKAFHALRDVILKEFTESGSKLVRFSKTPQSALSILDTVASPYNEAAKFNFEDMVVNIWYLSESSFAANVLTDIQDRIHNLQSDIPTLQEDLVRASAQSDVLLVSSLTPRLEEAQRNLQEELQEFQTLRTPDDLNVYDSNIIATKIFILDSEHDVVHASTISPGWPQRVRSILPREDETGDGDGAPLVPDVSIVALQISPPDLDNGDVHGSTIVPTGQPPNNPRMPEGHPPKRGIFSRATSWVKRSVKSLTRRHLDEA